MKRSVLDGGKEKKRKYINRSNGMRSAGAGLALSDFLKVSTW